MHGEFRAVVAVRRALGERSPLLSIERDLIDLALADEKPRNDRSKVSIRDFAKLSGKYSGDAARRILRASRERAAAASGPTAMPTIEEFAAALRGSPNQRVTVLARWLIATLEDGTKGSDATAQGGHAPPGVSGGGP